MAQSATTMPWLRGLLLAFAAATTATAARHTSPPRSRSPPTLPNWEPTYNSTLSTVIMPCNWTGLVDPRVYKGYGLVDFDWNSAKAIWSSATPMTCEETLVKQAEMTKAENPGAKVFVYRNLVKALPWYTSVREKITDPAYAGWFLKFKPGGSLPGGTWHSPNCSTDASGTKCSALYHDQEQTPQPPQGTRVQDGAWFIYNNTNDVNGLHPGWRTVVDGGSHASWEGCRAAADTAEHKVFVWWPNRGTPNGTCWFTDDWSTPRLPGSHAKGPLPDHQPGHVSGYKPAPGEPAPSANPEGVTNCDTGVCDCGEGLPCGEYLWDHRNLSLRKWLIEEFVLGANGMANPNVDGYYFDDSWHTSEGRAGRQCDGSPVGGATEENFYCSVDMGLTAADVADITGNWSETARAAEQAVLSHKGFTWGTLVPSFAHGTT